MRGRTVGIALLLVFAVGCGGDDEPETDRAKEPAQTGATTRDEPATESAPAPEPDSEDAAALADCLSSAGFQDLTTAQAGLIRASDPETGAEVRVRLFASAAEAEEFAGGEALDTGVVGSAVAIYPDQLDQGAKTAAEGCMRGGGQSGSGGAEAPTADEAPPDRQRCDDVTVTPNSGDGLFEVTVSGISCDEARTALVAWGRGRYPDPGPPGFSCSRVERYPEGNVRVRCTGARQTIEFDTGV